MKSFLFPLPFSVGSYFLYLSDLFRKALGYGSAQRGYKLIGYFKRYFAVGYFSRVAVSKVALIVVLSISYAQSNAQVTSSHDGFYSADSVFYQLSGSSSFKYCINCYSADSLHAYSGGTWLHSRQNAPNTWENTPFSIKINAGDSEGKRANLVKGNTIWVRIYNDTGYIDQHHFVFLGNWRPKSPVLISVCVDSSDFFGSNGFYGIGKGLTTNFGVFGNYRLKIEPGCSYQVFGGPQYNLEAQQTAGIEISGTESVEYPLKAVQLNANKTAYKDKVLLLGKSLTDSLGAGIKKLRFRVGAANHRSSILANEIATTIIRPDIGGHPSVPVCLFINGSFWTYAMAEELLGKNQVSKVLKTQVSQVTLAKISPATPLTDVNDKTAKKVGRSSTYTLCDHQNQCDLYYAHSDTLQFQIDTINAGLNVILDNLCNAVKGNNDSKLLSIINRESIYQYVLSIWFFQNSEKWDTRLMMAKVGDKPWSLFAEHYDFLTDAANDNDWDDYFNNFQRKTAEAKTIPWLAANRLLSIDRDYFCLVLQDELNTTYNVSRTTGIARKKIESLRPCINECHKAWGDNDWPDSLAWNGYVAGIIPFLEQRPNAIAKALPAIFLSDSAAALTLKDRNKVNIRFDSIPDSDVTVKLNSLVLKADFTGVYYPRPDLRVEVVYDPAKYEFVKWLEYPKAPPAFKLSASKPITLTPVLRLKPGAIIKKINTEQEIGG